MTKQEEINTYVDSLFPDTTQDENIRLKEFFDDLFKVAEDNIVWKEKYESLDKEWRQRYSDRFNGTKSKIEEDLIKEDEPEIIETPRSFDDLFEVKGE